MFLTDGGEAAHTVSKAASVIVSDLVKLIQECDASLVTSLAQIIDLQLKDVKQPLLDDSFVYAVWKAVQV